GQFYLYSSRLEWLRSFLSSDVMQEPFGTSPEPAIEPYPSVRGKLFSAFLGPAVRCVSMKKNEPRERNDLPDGLAAPALRALSRAGIATLAQLAKVTESEISELHGMGPKAVGQLKAAMRARRLKFAGK